MKKLFALILAVALMATLSVTAFAADYDTEGNKGMNVTYSVNPGYTVTIPETVTIGADGTEMTVSAEDVVVEKGLYVSVTLAADNNFTVKTAEGAELTYTVTKGGQSVAAGGEILAVNPASAAGGSANITFAINEADVKYAGTYTGTATFTIAVKDVPTISFKFYENGTNYWSGDGEDYVVYTVLEGTTWGEWLASEDNVYNLTDGEDCIYAPGPAFLEYADKEAEISVWPLVDDEIMADGIYTLARY